MNRQSKENEESKEGVIVSTMHSTKGLEFERVFLPDVNEDVIPHKKSMKEEDVEEERRLFYVGVTRAKKYLHILSVKSYIIKTAGHQDSLWNLKNGRKKGMQKMENRPIPRAGEFYMHFKGKLYQIITVASHTETEEELVIYQALYGTYKTYARPLEMFLSEVDHKNIQRQNKNIVLEKLNFVKMQEIM